MRRPGSAILGLSDAARERIRHRDRVNDLLKPQSIVVMLGCGGVGKTTVAAALGVAGAAARLRTAVITVDPARRLREALGVPRLGHRPTRIDARRLRAAGLDPRLELSAMVLDVKGAWDAMVAEHVPDAAARRRILDNAFYQSLSSRFAGADAYAALEALYQLHARGNFDFEVVDTPPAAHAFEFVQAPARLARLLDSQAARWLFEPAGKSASLALRLAGRIAGYVARELERFAGARTLASMSEFVAACAGAAAGIDERMHRVAALIRSPAVRFVLVTTAEPDRLRDARRLIEQLKSEQLNLAGVVVNRFLDQSAWSDFDGDDDLAPPAGNNRRRPRRAQLERLLNPAFDEIAAMRAALDGARDQGAADANAALAYLERYRRSAVLKTRRLEKFIETVPPRVSVTLVPEIRPGASGLAALRRLSRLLLAPRAQIAGAREAPPPGRAPRRRAGGDGGRGAEGRMPE